MKLYYKCGGHLHRGSMSRIYHPSNPKQPPQIERVLEWGNKFSTLLSQHHIASFTNKKHFLCFLSHHEANGSAFATAVVNALIWYFGIWLIQFIFNALYLYSKKNYSFLTKHKIEIQDDALFEETKYNRSYFFWNKNMKVFKRPGFVAIYVSQNMAHIIPRRAFRTKEQMQTFVNKCKTKLNET